MNTLTDWASSGRLAGSDWAPPQLDQKHVGHALREFSDLRRVFEDPNMALEAAATAGIIEPMEHNDDPLRDCPACAKPGKAQLKDGA